MFRQFEISTRTNSATDMRRYEARARVARAVVVRAMFSGASRVAVRIAAAVVGGSGARLNSEGKHCACARVNEKLNDRIPADSGLTVDDLDASDGHGVDPSSTPAESTVTASNSQRRKAGPFGWLHQIRLKR